MAEVTLGDRVKDPITGFQGIAWSRISYLTGCDRIEVMKETTQQSEGKEIMTILVFDEPQLKIVKRRAKTVEVEKNKTGGPRSFMPDTGSRK